MRLSAIAATTLSLATLCVLAGSQSASAQSTQPSQPNQPAPNVVVVQAGDNLDKIATDKQTTYVRLFDANTQIQDPDVIHPGDNVRIPAPDEQLASRPIPTDAPAVAPQPTQQPTKTSARASASTSSRPVTYSGDASVWDRLAQCESGGNWSISTGNGFYGGLQFTTSSWHAVGGSGTANQASREEQIARAQMLQARQGWGAWPACASKLGLR